MSRIKVLVMGRRCLLTGLKLLERGRMHMVGHLSMRRRNRRSHIRAVHSVARISLVPAVVLILRSTTDRSQLVGLSKASC